MIGPTTSEGAEFTGVSLREARFTRSSLRGARFTGTDLSGARFRGVMVEQLDLDSPWLGDGEFVRVNGVNVIPLIEAELNRVFPGRELRRAEDPAGLRAAWAAIESAWEATLDRVAAAPEGTVDISVEGEWSFAQTLRHLVMATDTWLGRAILGIEQPYHPLGLANAEAEEDGLDLSLFTTDSPAYAEVLTVRADRVASVRHFIADLSAETLDEERANPWAPQYPETVRTCLHTILEEEWEHHRYAVRDLEAIDADLREASG